VVQVLRRGVAAVQPCLVGHHAKPRADVVEPVGKPQPVELDQARIGVENPAQAAQRRGLSRAILSKQDEDLAALDVQVDAIDGAHVVETLA
jgi:hypothetical protein